MKRHFTLLLLVASAIAMGAQNPPNCPDMSVRANSPCVLGGLGCQLIDGQCPGQGDYIFSGPFQCDVIQVGSYCVGDSLGQKNCYFRGKCILTGLGNNCVTDLQDVNGQMNTLEGKKTDPCPVAPPGGGGGQGG